MPFRALFRRIHLIATLSAGLWLALSGLSGSLLVFGDDLDPLVHPDLYRVSRPGTHGSKVPIEAVLGEVQRQTGETIIRMRLAGRDTPVHEIWIGCDRCRRVWVDPSTGAINGIRSYDGTTRLWLHEFHRRMMLGDMGETLVGFAGFALLLIVLTGIYLWIPRNWSRAFRLQLAKGWKVAVHDLHRTGGMVVAPLLLITATTGIYFVFHGPIDRAVSRWVDAGLADENSRADRSMSPASTITETVAHAERMFPESDATWVTPPPAGEGTVTVRLRQSFEAHPNGRTFVSINRESGAVTMLVDPANASIVSRVINELYPLHIGRTGGLTHRLLLVILGLTPTLFLATGLLMWWNRSLRRSWSRLSQRESADRLAIRRT